MKLFENKVVVVTGGAHGIGATVVSEFEKEGAKVAYIDIRENPCFVGDLSKKDVLEKFAQFVIEKYGHVDVLVNNALPLMKGIDECSYEEFSYALAVGVTAPFYLAKLFAPHFGSGASIINISSSRDRMSQPQTESYTAAKGGIAALTHALAVSFAGAAACRPRRKPLGHREHGALPRERKSRLYYRRKHLHRRRHDPPNGLPQRLRLEIRRIKNEKNWIRFCCAVFDSVC